MKQVEEWKEGATKRKVLAYGYWNTLITIGQGDRTMKFRKRELRSDSETSTSWT